MKILFQWGCPDFTVAKILQQTLYGDLPGGVTTSQQSEKRPPPKKKRKKKEEEIEEEDDEILTIILLIFLLDVKRNFYFNFIFSHLYLIFFIINIFN